MAGFDVKLAIDNWEDALVTYRFNHKHTDTLNADLLNLDPAKVEQDFNLHEVDVIIGGPPCQGFSVAGKRIIDDDRNKLYKSFVRFVDSALTTTWQKSPPIVATATNGVVRRTCVVRAISKEILLRRGLVSILDYYEIRHSLETNQTAVCRTARTVV